MIALQVFNVIFLVEAVLKIIAYGIYQEPTSYFRSRGNWLEFFLAIVGLVQLLLGNLYQAEIRVMLSLRPARIAVDVKSMRRIVSVIEKSLKELVGVGALMLFSIFIFSIVGKGQFMGSSFTFCRFNDESNPDTYHVRDFNQGLCNPREDTCLEGTSCFEADERGMQLREDGIMFDRGLNFGIINFDNFWDAMLLVF